jgi:chaperonin GroES
MQLTPIQNQVVVRQDKPRATTPSKLIHLVEEQFEHTGTVVAVGPGKSLADGRRSHMSVAVGDRVVFRRRGGIAVVPDRREAGSIADAADLDTLVLRDDQDDGDILAVIEPELAIASYSESI